MNTKTADNKRTLLHFLADTVEKKFPDYSTFADELIHIEQASRGTSHPVLAPVTIGVSFVL